MKTFKAYVKKEIIEGLRNYRFLVLMLVMIIFAILDPLMLKLLPVIVGNQISEGLTELFNITQTFAVQNYIKDVSQLINIVFVLTLAGLLVDERHNKTLIFPYTKGVSVTGMIIGKNLVYSVALLISIFIGFCVNYYYSSILFVEESVYIVSILKIAGLFSLYYIFVVSLVIFLGSFSQRKLFVGIGSLVILFAMSFLGNINAIKDFLPSNLINFVGRILIEPSASLFDSRQMIVTFSAIILYICIFTSFTIYRMNKVEIV